MREEVSESLNGCKWRCGRRVEAPECRERVCGRREGEKKRERERAGARTGFEDSTKKEIRAFPHQVTRTM